MLKNLLVAAILAVSFGVAGAVVDNSKVLADGSGSPIACNSNPKKNPNASNVKGSQTGTVDKVTVDAGAGNIVTGVCIKSGENMFNGNQHSQVLVNGTYENGCYQVSGVGTQIVTVERLRAGDDCQEISHVDAIVGKPGIGGGPNEPETPTNPETPNEPETTSENEDEAPAQVVAPKEGVNAGGGAVMISAAGLVGSLAAAGYGALRLKKQS